MDAHLEYLAEIRIRKLEAELSKVAELECLREERDALASKLARYDMCAGHAEQRRAESRAMREALGFAPDADDVSPRDLLGALARQKLLWQAEALEEVAEGVAHCDRRATPRGISIAIKMKAKDIQKQSEEKMK